MTISHHGQPVARYWALLNSCISSDLRSPYRSTVPLLAYWRDADQRLAEPIRAGLLSGTLMEFGELITRQVRAG